MLTSVRCLDFTRVLAGPLATMILGDLGADVIKIERPGTGDETRGWGPPFDDRGESAYYLSVNRNKLSIALDLDEAADIATAAGLIAGADLVIDNFIPGTLERRGIDPDALLVRHPRLIWCTITGFGPDNPRAGYDLVVQAESGWMAITGDPDGDPTKIGIALADVIAGKDAAIAMLAALVRRGTSGNPASPNERRLFISLIDSARAALVNVAQNSLVSGSDARRWGNQHPNLVPYQLFHSADRPFIVAVGSDAQWKSFTRAIGLADLEGNDELSTNAGRLANRREVIKRIGDRLRERTAAEWLHELDAARVPCGVVKTVLESVSESGASSLTGVPPSVPGSVRLPPPRLNEHGELIRSAGWAAFRSGKVPEL
jgi:crotonobetainyl-CoA:carnitine CoA-transferase CaiB-like acyl-CoA transferase